MLGVARKQDNKTAGHFTGRSYGEGSIPEGAWIVVEGYVHSLGIGGRFRGRDLYARFEPLALDTVEIITPERDVQAGEAGIIAASVTVAKALA
jgi:hypothetical protein